MAFKGRIENELLDSLHRELKPALRRLKVEQGRVARRNARTSLFDLLRKLRGAIDAAYPLPRRERTSGATPAKRAKVDPVERMNERGWLRLGDAQRERDLLTAGVRVLPVKVGGTWLKYAPRWAVEAPPGTPVGVLGKARRSPKLRAALTTAGKVARASTGAAS